MAAKHTEGPWVACAGYLQPFVTAPNPNGGEHRITVATCNHPADAFFQHQREANARLMAAAPDLLEALKSYVDWFGAAHVDGCPADDTCFCSGSAINDAVNRAIAKAEGVGNSDTVQE